MGEDAFAGSVGAPGLPVSADAEDAARTFLDRSLCCAVEVRSPAETGRLGWQPYLVVLRGGDVREVVEAITETAHSHPSQDIRIAGYDPRRLTRVASPEPFVCVNADDGEGRARSLTSSFAAA